ncbi:MAG: dihydrodipicolinate synthase family protein [Sedimentisphaeraceae bacterium JB056]
METHKLPKGLWPVMLTPFNEDKSINYREYESLINYYIDNSAAGLFASCGSSEMDMLSGDELFELAAKAVEFAGGRVPVVAGAIIIDELPKQIDMVKRMAQSGVDTVVIGMSQFAREDESEDTIISRIDSLISETEGIRLGLYECPHPYRRTFSSDKFDYLINTGRFYFHKDTCCEAEGISAKVKSTINSNTIFLNAHFPTLEHSLKCGGDGYCGVVTNFFPDLLAYICENYFETQQIDQAVMDFISSADEVVRNKYPRSAKMFINRNAGIITDCCRTGVEFFNDTDLKLVDMFIQKYKTVQESVFIAK